MRLTLWSIICLWLWSAGQGTFAQENCIDIDEVTLTGVTLIDPQMARGDIDNHLGCVPFETLNSFLETVTFAYVDAGYIAARAYLPEQDISDRELTIAVVEGALTGIELVLNDMQVSDTARVEMAFPGLIGLPVNIRHVEQGLDQLNRLTSVQTTIELAAGDAPGETILQVTGTEARPWRGAFTLDDRGGTNSGIYTLGLSLTYDNILGLNDLISLSYQRNIGELSGDGLSDKPNSDSLSLNYSLPYGYWTFSAGLSASQYVNDIPGLTSSVETAGYSRSLQLTAARVLNRTQQSRTSLSVGFTLKENENLILGSRIDTSSRRLAVLALTLDHSRPLWGGALSLSLQARQGLAVLGAESDHGKSSDAPRAEFSNISTSAQYQRQFEFGERAFLYQGSLRAQGSPHHLLGSEQIGLGGFGSVRGIREGQIYGNWGLEWRNQLSTTLLNLDGRLRLDAFATLDAGHVFSQSRYDVPGGTLAGWSVGLRGAAAGGLTFDLSYGQLAYAPDTISTSEGLLTFQTGFSF